MAGTWQFWAVLAAAFAAITAVFAKIGVTDAPADVAVWLRTIAILAVLTVFMGATGGLSQLKQANDSRTLLFLGLSGVAAAASWLAYFRALKLGPVAWVAPVDKLSIALVAGLGALLLREQIGALQWFGIALVTIGAVLVGSG